MPSACVGKTGESARPPAVGPHLCRGLQLHARRALRGRPLHLRQVAVPEVPGPRPPARPSLRR
eukprot:2474570-Lingulodinium_polyedra.AAC.1